MAQSKSFYEMNAFSYEDAFGRIAIALLAHPFDYVKILIQLGYEPLPAYPSKSIFGRPRLALPGVFKYMGYIRKTDGFFGIYRGLSYKLLSTVVNGFVFVNANEWQKRIYGKEDSQKANNKSDDNGIDMQKLYNLLRDLTRETTSRFIALSISYPLHLMTIRMCAQFIGREHHYDSLFSAINDIYQTGGIGGFYVGFVPRFMGECLVLWLGSTIIFVVNSFVDGESGVKNYLAASVNFILSSLMYPFQLVSTVMCCNGDNARSLLASAYTGPQYVDWIDCWRNLSEMGQLKRGASLIWRTQPQLTNTPPLYQHNIIVHRKDKNW